MSLWPLVMTEMRERGDCLGVFNSPTEEEWCGERHREKRGRKKIIFQGKTGFLRFLLFEKPVKAKECFPSSLPKMELLEQERRGHLRAQAGTQSSAFCSKTFRLLQKHNHFLSGRRNKNPYYYSSCVIAKFYPNTTTDIKYLTPLNCLFHGL